MSKKKKYTKYDEHKKLITKITRQGHTLGVDKITDVPKACESMDCIDCAFYSVGCVSGRKAWLNSKYEEPKRVFTDEQKDFIRTCDTIKFLARDYNGRLFTHSEKLNKASAGIWVGRGVVSMKTITSIDFPQIKWEDKEPTSREEILGGLNMQDDQKQIEGMAKVMQKDFCDGFADNRGCCISRSSNNNCIDCKKVFADETNEYAEKLYAAGYRKQSDTAKEILKRLKELLHKHEYRNQTDGVPFYQMDAESFCDEINEIAAQYGVEVEG